MIVGLTALEFMLACGLGLAVALVIYYRAELELQKAISESKSKRIEHHAATNVTLYKQAMDKEKQIKGLKGITEGRAILIQDLEDKLKKANTVSNHSYTIEVNAEELSKEIIKNMKEKYGKFL